MRMMQHAPLLGEIVATRVVVAHHRVETKDNRRFCLPRKKKVSKLERKKGATACILLKKERDLESLFSFLFTPSFSFPPVIQHHML